MGIVLSIASKFDPKGLGDAERGMKSLGSSVSKMGSIAAVSFGALAVGAGAFAFSSAKAAAESEAVARSLDQVAKNSGAFGSTTEQVKIATQAIMEHNQKLSNLTGIDDEILNSIVRGWMAVPDLAGKGVKGLEKMVRVVADVAAGTGKDVQAIGQMFVKVAGDEETAMSKLTRAGIVLSDQQKTQYDQLLETSGEMAAQNYLIDELGKTYAGAAEAAANPFAVLTQNVQNMQEQIGVYLLPVVQGMVDKFQELISTHGPQLEEMFSGVAYYAGLFIDGLGDFAAWYDENPEIFNWLIAGIAGVTAAAATLSIALDANPISIIILALVALGIEITMLATNWNGVSDRIGAKWTETWDAILGTTQNVVNGIISALNFLISPLNSVIGLLNQVFGLNISELKIPEATFATDTMKSQLKSEGIDFGYEGGTPKWGNPKYTPRKFATGGIVTKPIAGIVGEAGPEAVIPLKDAGGLFGGSTYNITVQSGVGDPVSIGEQVIAVIKRYERANGAVFVGA